MTLREALIFGTNELAANPHLCDHATHDAEQLLLHHLGISKARRYSDPGRRLTPDEQLIYLQGLKRRLANEPLQYITGHQEFYGRSFHVTPVVLIPRPETEHLVEAVLERLPSDRPLNILDVGTGSGILAVTLALQLPYAQLTAVDISPDALAIARRNADALHAAERIRFVQSDLLDALAGQTFNCIVSNPPYVPTTDAPTLHPQVRDYEPAIALFAGPDGLDLYRRLIPAAYAALVPAGLLALEIGHSQRPGIASLLCDWDEVASHDDLQGIPRVVLARRPARYVASPAGSYPCAAAPVQTP